MSLQVGIGVSDDLDEPAIAVAEAVKMARAALQGEEVVAAVVFASIDFDQEALMLELHAALGDVPMVGCTTDGEISSYGTWQDSVSIMLLGGAGLAARAAIAEGLSTRGARLQARETTARLSAGMGARGRLALTFPDCSGTGLFNEFLGGMKEVLGRHFPIFGGGPGDKARLQGVSYQYCDFRVFRDAGPMLLLDGDFRLASGLRSGVMPFGRTAVCTRSVHNVVYEIDHRPAIEHHRAYLGDEVVHNATIASFPYILSSSGDFEDGDYYVTLPTFSWIQESGAISCVAPIPEGSTMKLGRCTRENILRGARVAAEELNRLLEGRPPRALFMFSCSGRKQILGMDVHRELEAVQSVLGSQVPTLGFYCYGELGPLSLTRSQLSECEFHGYTLSMLALA